MNIGGISMIDDIPVLEIYLDILFILNFIMDYFIFWMVGKMTYEKVSSKKLCLGSAIGALFYCLIATVPFLRVIPIGLYLILLPIIPIIIIFKPSNLRKFIQFFIISNMTALVVGGICFGFFYWIERWNVVSHIYKASYGEFSIWVLLMSIVASYGMIQLSRYYMQKRNTQIQELYTLKIQFNGQVVETQALLDTGNKVYDPLTKEPVIIVTQKILQSLLPQNINMAYASMPEDISFLINEASRCDFGIRIRAIPYHSLGNPNGILLGFKADEVHISKNHSKWERVEDAIIAIYQYDLNVEGTYHALLHGDVVNKKI